ncbi:ABC transporter permease [Sinanaerobacter chloroacetimidivorans]|uniref:Iron export ABC transporter permease subunit FetB n=1 Tax=Sinanaerobacter chloroacetimidivorans TaxID=2818044 RepID=A0A8J7W796_9FIRM|nr:iron export ABC transporter permease subunit FetB [Sinanaerobacter chloroacetimidivorans]MBR0600613.1 iron export ABC transporter permease subunit FetB [Sinanaerobacter chloroacetimidivorans]
MNNIIDLTFWQILLAYIFVLIVLFFVHKRGLKREKEIVISSLRMTLQLILTGYVLVAIFSYPNPLLTGVMILLMEIFAIGTILRKFKGKVTSKLRKIIAVSMFFGTFSCLIYFLFIVVRISPWYDPRYFIPIAGMLIGNSMTGISLGVKSLSEGIETQRNLIEEALILGATPQMAMREIINRTFDAAIMPTIQSMMGMGIVFLPGMMTGQILSGTLPTTAIAYQIAIMLGILGAVSVSVMIMLQLGYRTYFNEEDQLL